MSRREFLDLYIQGWASCDVNTTMRALADDFVFDNPRVGKVTKSQFESYFEDMQKFVATHRTGPAPGPFMEFDDQVSEDTETKLINWTWWRIPGTKIEGAGLIEVTDSGVINHRMAFHAAPKL